MPVGSAAIVTATASETGANTNSYAPSSQISAGCSSVLSAVSSKRLAQRAGQTKAAEIGAERKQGGRQCGAAERGRELVEHRWQRQPQEIEHQPAEDPPEDRVADQPAADVAQHLPQRHADPCPDLGHQRGQGEQQGAVKAQDQRQRHRGRVAERREHDRDAQDRGVRERGADAEDRRHRAAPAKGRRAAMAPSANTANAPEK